MTTKAYLDNDLPLLSDVDATFALPTPAHPTISGQNASVHIPASDPGYPAVVLMHQASGNELFIDSGFMRPMVDFLTGRGFVCGASNMHGDQWGNDTAVADVENLLGYMAANSNADTDNIFVIGLSMGFCNACNYVAHGVANVLAMVSLVGVCDLGYMHDTAGFATSIDTAYGNHAGYVAAYNERDPLTLAQAGTFDDIPIAMWYGSSDTTVGPAKTVAFHAATPRSRLMGDVLAHFGIGLMYPPQAGSWVLGRHAAATVNRTPLLEVT